MFLDPNYPYLPPAFERTPPPLHQVVMALMHHHLMCQGCLLVAITLRPFLMVEDMIQLHLYLHLLRMPMKVLPHQ